MDFKIPEKRAEIFSLKELQSEILRHNSIIEKYAIKKNELQKEIEKTLRTCYKDKLTQFYLHKCARYLTNPKLRKPPMFLLCKNEKEYLSATFIYMTKIIVPLKKNPMFFKFLVDCIDNSKALSEDELDDLAEEMVDLFLSDFTSFEQSLFVFLNHMNTLLPALFNKCKTEKIDKPFAVPCFVNRMLSAYLNQHETTKYVKMIFDNALTYIQESSYQSAPQKLNPSEIIHDEDLFKLIDEIINNMQRKLLYFPFRVRMFCRVIQEHAEACLVDKGSVEIVKQLIIDFLFDKWWNPALTNPKINELIDICTINEGFNKRVTYLMKVLEAILYSKEDLKSFSPSVSNYIESKQKFSEYYLMKLLEVKYLAEKQALEPKVIINSSCISIKGLKIIKTLLNDNLEELMKLNDIYGKCIKHLQLTTSSKQGNRPPVLEPTVASFSYELIGNFDPLTQTDLDLDLGFYVIFNDIEAKEMMQKDFFTEKWQKLLQRLLLAIDLSSHCSISQETSAELGQNEIVETMKEMAAYPIGFIIDKDSETKVALLGHYLSDTFKNLSEGQVTECISDLKLKYTEAIEDLVRQTKEVEDEMQSILRSLYDYSSLFKQTNNTYLSKTIAAIIADYIIKQYSIPYEIYNESKSSEEYQYVIKFVDNASKESPKSKRSDLVAAGNTIKEFVDSYIKLKGLGMMVSNNVDPFKAGGVYKEFMKIIEKKVRESKEKELLIIKGIKEVLICIENYIISNIYYLVFPKEPSEDDKMFSGKLIKLQSAKIPELLQNDDIPKDLLSIAISKFQNMPLLKSPYKKIENSVQVCTILREGLNFKNKFSKTGPLPYGYSQLLVFVVLNSNLSCLISDINYINWFRINLENDPKDNSEQSYSDLNFTVNFLNKLQSVST